MVQGRLAMEGQNGAMLRDRLAKNEAELQQMRVGVEMRLRGEKDMLVAELEKLRVRAASLEQEKEHLNDMWR